MNKSQLLFCAIFIIWEAKSSTQMVRFFFHLLFANCVHVSTDVRPRLEIFLETLKCSSGHVQCSFDIPHEKFSLIVRKFLGQNPKKIIKLRFSTKSIPRKKFKKKRFRPFEKRIQQNRWAQNLLVPVGSLVKKPIS